ncbi:hypothetical protein CJ179_49680 [Rhodococcus sp. ACS1]|nr:hypothetical protein CJ179_49680 [Rhodococcus sp. ACS1]
MVLDPVSTQVVGIAGDDHPARRLTLFDCPEDLGAALGEERALLARVNYAPQLGCALSLDLPCLRSAGAECRILGLRSNRCDAAAFEFPPNSAECWAVLASGGVGESAAQAPTGRGWAVLK